MTRTLVFLLPASLAAQLNTAHLSGTVFDPSRGVVRAAAITALNHGTGARRTAHTDARGRYSFTHLAPGAYQLTARRDGFAATTQHGVELSAGRESVCDLTLQIGPVSAETLVTAEPDLVETRAQGMSSAMDTRSIQELPLNGRDFAHLALLESGVAPSRRTSDSGGPGTKLVIGGNRPSQVSFVLDGSDINDANNNTPGSVAGVLLGVDTLREFRVLSNAYSAAYGRSAGGVISAVTKSGANQFRGSLFEFVRNSAFDAKNFFDAPDAPIPPFRRNQFGATLHGPIVRDRAFFLASYEGLRQRLGLTSHSVVPDAASRKANVHPSVEGYLDLIPLPNERSFGDGTGEFVSAASQPTDQNFFTGRVDFRPSEATSVFARYTFDKAAVRAPDALRVVRSDSRSFNRYFTAEATHIVSERTVNTTRFSYNRSDSGTANTFLREVDSSLAFLPGQPLGQISVTGLFSLGPNRFGPSFSVMDLYQFSSDLSRIAGRHSIKAGADHRFYGLLTSRPQSPYGYYQFNSLADFLQARPAAVELTAPGSLLDRDWRQSMTAAYFEDTVQLTRRLTVNLGVRYERVSVPEEANGRSANVRDPQHDAMATRGPMFTNPSNLNFAPRAGIAWDPFGDGRTSVRSGFGIFYDPLWTDFYANAGNRQAPFYTLGSVRNPVFPRADAVVNDPGFILGRQDIVAYHPQNPYVMQYSLSVQRQVWRNTAATLSYSGQRGRRLVRFIDGNQALPQVLENGRKFFPEGAAPRNPHFTGIRYKATDGQSFYNALLASLEHRFARGLQLQVNYAFSRNIDDGSISVTQGGDNDLPQDPDSRKAERGLSNYDVRHYFVAHWTHELGRGWQWSAITSLSSGNPFSVLVGYDRARARFQAGSSPQRPDLAPGASNNPILGGPDRYFDPSAFTLPEAGFYGNLGRNTLTGPGLANVDLSLSKRFRLTEGAALQFRAEAFNLFNRPNFAIPSQRTVFSGAGRVGSAGRITSTTTPARQLQFGLKLTF
jgi:hypothetical protein